MSGLQRNANTTTEATESQKAVAFVNWALPMQDGTLLKAGKGFAIFQNPKYPNHHEDMLVELAKANGGTVEVDLVCRISINKSQDVRTVDLSKIAIRKPVAPAAPAGPEEDPTV